ncbi:MAG: YceI family protein [Planctomycetes bacterium]|nr:YceI family protein [Planctomycetota bacterium]
MKALLVVPVLFTPFLFPAETGSSGPAAPRGAAWNVDSAHSSVVFKVKHAGISNFYGTFNEVSGEVVLDPASPGDGKVELTIPVASLDTRNEKRDEHVMGPDFFDGKENPEIHFVSSKIKGAGKDGFAVEGELTMAGKKHGVTLEVAKTGEGDFMGGHRAGYEATFTVKRSDFGMKYGLDGGALGDEVTLMVALELTAAK